MPRSIKIKFIGINGLFKKIVLLGLVFLSMSTLALDLDQKPISKNLGLRLQFNQAHAIFGFRINNQIEIIGQAGYQFRYFESYSRITRIRMGILPMLASYGPVGELGISLIEEKNNIYVGIQYKSTRIDEGRDDYVDWGDLSIINDVYSRQDQSITLKGQLSKRVNENIEPYIGFGVRGTYSLYDFPGVLSDFNKYSFGPSLLLGVRVILVQF